VGFTIKAIWLATLVAATYPVAVAAHVAFDSVFGDALLLTEWLHGSRRAAANALIDGWVASIPWVLGFWAIAIALRAASGRQRRAEIAALLLIGAALIAAILLLSIDVPLQLVLLLLSAAALESCRVGRFTWRSASFSR
jgi:hypothetical protein